MSKLLTIALVSLVGSFQYQLWFSEEGVQRTQQVSQMIKQQENKLVQISKQNARLAYEISNLKHKEEEIEHSARSKLGMIKEGEVFYQVVDEYENFN